MPFAFDMRRGQLRLDVARIVGVINVTPDSFSDGGVLRDVEAAVAFGIKLAADGADVLDVGGESTRPVGATAVGAVEEIARTRPVIERLVERTRVPVAIDTTKAEVAAAALDAGAEIVNDISGGRFDARMIPLCAERGAVYVLGHVRGADLAATHASEEQPPTFDEVAEELAERLFALPIDLRQRTIVDPGLGFGKKLPQNLELLARAGELGARLARPVMVGPSRKRFLGELTGRPVDDRDDATVGACLAAVAAGAELLRVHDVKRVRDALTVFERVRHA